MKGKFVVIGVVVSVLLFVCSGYFWYLSGQKRMKNQNTYQYSEEVFGNALMGYAPPAIESQVTDDIHLLYVDITWAELEKEQGKYDWQAIEEENQFERWRSEGKHIVLRFLLDYPSSQKHKDIPGWLYEKMEDPGDWYNSSYGKGFSPNYSNPEFQKYYKRAVKAMGERWGSDSFFSYIELGVLGHWGEWHVDTESNVRQLPSEPIREEYVTPWLEAFPESKLLMRRPFRTAKRYQMGLYNDVTGDAPNTLEWLEWIEKGGIYNQTNEDSMVPMPTAWQSSPIGGEFTSGIPMHTLLGSQLHQTLELLQDSHTTFLGPKIAMEIDDNKAGYRAVLKKMGYRLWISSAQIKENEHSSTLTLVWENSGIAPFYGDWPAYIYVSNRLGLEVEKVKVPLQVSIILPGQSETVEIPLNHTNLENYQVSLGIVDPMTNKDAVRFAVKGKETQKRLVLFE